MTPWLDDGDLRLYHGDALTVLRSLPDGCVDMVATSPPFYGLRDYGTDGQIGLEETPDQWVDRLVAVFRECRRVLADHGTLWVEIGDSYASGSLGDSGRAGVTALVGNTRTGQQHRTPVTPGTKSKDLLGQPWMLAFALRADGWYLRSEIIWARPNPMPESVTDRPTKSHSTVFLLSKRPRYFYDADAIREPYNAATADHHARYSEHANNGKGNPHRADGGGTRQGGFGYGKRQTLHPSLPEESPRGPDGRRQTTVQKGENSEQHRDGERWPNPTGANARSVWTIATEPTPFAHFATWPQALVRRMILAGTSERGKCPECGKPWVRETIRQRLLNGGPTEVAQARDEAGRIGAQGVGHWRFATDSRTVGWSPSCGCLTRRSGVQTPWEPVPCVVLDPFAGSGTTLLVARNHGRHAIGIDLSLDYLQLAARRLQQLSLLT